MAYLKTGNRTLHDMAFLSLFSGMRFGEVKSLKWGAVDLDRSIITIFDAKGGKSRTAFMSPEVREMFTGWEKGGLESLIFPTYRRPGVCRHADHLQGRGRGFEI